MKIYTSYFGNLKALQKAGIYPISIARYSPKYLHNITIFEFLAPTPDMLKMKWVDYVAAFNRILARMDVKSLIRELEKCGDGKDVALLCYEKDPTHCHRKLAGDWITKKTGVEVTEFKTEEEIRKMKEEEFENRQQKLF